MLSKAGDQAPVMFSREIFKSVLGSPSHIGGICVKLVVVEFTIVISKLVSSLQFGVVADSAYTNKVVEAVMISPGLKAIPPPLVAVK